MAAGQGREHDLRGDALLEGRHVRDHADELALQAQAGQRVQRRLQRLVVIISSLISIEDS